MAKKEKTVKTVYTEPADYIPKELREKYKLGEYAEKEEEIQTDCGGTKKPKPPKTVIPKEFVPEEIKNAKPAEKHIPVTELVFILDRSGSMSGLESDTIGGFNGMLADQKKKDGECFVSTVLFDHETLVLHDRLPLEQVEKLTERDYQVRGCTALLDALGKSIVHIENIHKYARKEDVPENTVFVIITDGLENASKEFSSDKVKKMIEKKKESSGWEFLFIGANIDAVETASHIGISEDRAVNYHADKRGTNVVYKTVSNAVACVRESAPLAKSWSEEIEKDYKKRK